MSPLPSLLSRYTSHLLRRNRTGMKCLRSVRRSLSVEHLEDRTLLTAGMLDPTFGVGGRVTTDFGSSSMDLAEGVAVQSDGKIVVVGQIVYQVGVNTVDFGVVRLNANGSPDTSFGTNGRVAVDLGGADEAWGVAMQSDGKIVVIGTTYGMGYAPAFAVARLNSDGSLDMSFDEDGMQTIDFGFGAQGKSIVVQSNGRIVVAGTCWQSGADFAVARLNSNGSLDTSFDGDGKQVIDFGAEEYSRGVALQSGGRIVVAGYTFQWDMDGQSTAEDYAVACLNADGSLDTSFNGGSGKQTVDFGSNDQADAVAVQPDGGIVLAGWSNPLGASVARLLANGDLDTSFDGDGRAAIDVSNSFIMAVALQLDGKIVLTGYSSEIFDAYAITPAVFRLLIDGSRDMSFNGNGKQTTDLGGNLGVPHAVVIQSDGKIVVAGTAEQGGGDFAVARFLGDPDTASDTDSDGIADAIDTLPVTFSNDFSDGSTTGTIVSRGDQILTIADAPNAEDGVIIRAAASGGSEPAIVSIDGGASMLSLQPGDQLVVTHGSVIVHVLAGTVEATFVGDSGEVATASLSAGNKLTFKPETFVFSAPATNTGTVQVLVNGTEIEVGSGEAVRSVQIDITPGSASNTLNLASNGVISVAILSTTGFDARTANVASLLFAGAHAVQSSIKDVNGDGIRDLVVNFRTQDTTLRLLYEQLVAEDINQDGVLDSNHETARVGLTGLCQDGTVIFGADAMDLFLSGKALRDMLAALAAAGMI